ncbi:hypothetical protein FB45DRAFT_887509 [Roridomyces roridus]|uniref:F-box domain-containing protein n=1 Tax=Roridomyces roridus TaxID=1738132 RepID=A0AAD7CJ44_9AGAR|nr:hypothetical protein FB45DRAFT_887509 [Roridomyces roridus]
MPPLLSLPQDILLEILTLLEPKDVLLLSQTCRGLHQYTLNDYVWHRLADKCDLPLDTHADLQNIPGPILQTIVTNALRVDLNWRRPISRLKKLTRVDEDTLNVHQIQFIFSQWLIVLRRSVSAASLSVWRVGHIPTPYRASFLDIPADTVPLKFSAAIQNGSEKVLIALISNTKPSGTLLSVYSVPLNSKTDDGFTPPRALSTVHRLEADGRFCEVHACGDMVAVAIFINTSAYRILFLNWVTGAQYIIDPQLSEQYTQLHFKLLPKHLVFAGVRSPSTLVLRIHDMTEGPMSLSTPDTEYEAETAIVDDYEFPADSARTSSHISLISFHSLVQRRGGDYIFHFPLRGSGHKLPSFVYPFHTHASASAEIVRLGETGRRAVWLERRWTNDEFTLMKAIFSTDERKPVVVAPLLARHTALPFELNTAVHSGELYLLEF